VRILAAAGRPDQARKVADAITDRPTRLRALAEIATVLASQGRHAQASSAATAAVEAARLENYYLAERAHALSAATRALVAAGQHGQARQIATEADAAAEDTVGWEKGIAQEAAAAALAAVGLFEIAADKVDIVRGYHRARVLADLAEKAATSRPEFARQQIALLLSEYHWTEAVHALASASPGVLTTLSALLIGPQTASINPKTRDGSASPTPIHSHGDSP